MSSFLQKRIARTDARTTLGLDEALRRGEAYAKAGADLLFIESPESEDEMRRIGQFGRDLGKPLIANMVEKGRTPVLSKEALEALGYSMAIFPVTALLASVQAMNQVYQQFKEVGSSVDSKVPLYDFGAPACTPPHPRSRTRPCARWPRCA